MANLIELFDNIVQMQNLNGVPLTNGKLYVYALGRTRLMDTWSDVDGESLNTNPIILDDAGQAHCFVSDDFDYTLVVCDAYDNEIFSIDKYLYSKGEHSHADVAVAPSEHIGVSSYHVGETTVYVPYIQGELGKTYHGIEPIVVNNQENKISARNIPLGVQSPLYFAEDSESACIIAMSGEYQPVTGMSGYATTGDLVDLATSVSETYQPKGDYATHDDLSGFMEESKLETADGKITGYDGTAFAGGGSVDPSEFIPWSASGNFATSGDLNDKLDTTAFSTVSGDFITAIPDTYASKDFVLSSVSSKLDSTAFSTVSGDFITALPEGLLNESGFEYDGDKISAYNGSAFGTELSGYELSAGNGISIDNYPIEQKTVISVTGNYATNTDLSNVSAEITGMIPAPFDPSYLSGQIDTKLDSAIYANDSGTFLTAHQDISDLMPKSESANFYPMTGNPSGFLTAHQSLEDYQTIEGMTAYQPVGDYLTTGDSANFYTTANESGFLTEVPESALSGKLDISSINTEYVTERVITAISSWPISARWAQSGNFLPMESAGLTASGAYLSNGGARFFGINTSGISANPNGGVTSVQVGGLNSPEIKIQGYYGTMELNSAGAQYLSSDNSVVWKVGEANHLYVTNANPDYQNIAIDIASAPRNVDTTRVMIGKYGLSACNIGSSAGMNTATAPATVVGNSQVKVDLQKMHSVLTVGDIYVQHNDYDASQTWSLTGSVQKREIEGDTATSAITAIAGSAIGGGVPAGTMNESAFEYDANDKISAYNGSAFAGGAGVSGDYELSAGEGISITDYPDDQKTVISVTGGQLPPEADEAISAVTANSGAWGGSALPISAGPGIKFEMVDNTLVASTDETMLFSGSDAWGYGTITLSESLKNFERIKVLATRAYSADGNTDKYSGPWCEFDCAGIASTTASWGAVTPAIYEGPYWKYSTYTANATFTQLNWSQGGYIKVTNPSDYAEATSWIDGKAVGIKAVIGINRK